MPKQCNFIGTAATVVCLLCLVVLATGAAAVPTAITINVPADYATIQAAINAASNGDEVVVAAGTYHERINFGGKNIVVRSTDPTDPAVVAATIINGDASGSVVIMNNSEPATAVLSGFTITNGANNTDGGAGILCWNSSATIENNVITGNSAVSNYGGGLGVYGGVAIIRNNTITGNSGAGAGGIWYAGYGKFEGNILRGNTATGSGGGGYGGGMTCATDGGVVSNNVFSGNSAAYGGGGIIFAACAATFANNTVSGNSAPQGGAIYTYNSPATITNNILANSPTGEGVAQSWGKLATFTYCDVYGNAGGGFTGMTDPTGSSGNISADPLFADAANNDFRLKSQGGRWDGATWTTDSVTSPCIDAGDPASAFANEPAPNGGRVNMGYDGNTAYASKTSPPTVVSATYVDWTHVDVLFSRAMDPTTVEDVANYSIWSPLALTAAVADGDGRTVHLTTGTQTMNTRYRVTVNAGQDASGTPIVPGTANEAFWGTPVPPMASFGRPFSTSVGVAAKICVIFSEPMVRPSAQNAMTINGVRVSTFGGTFSWVGRKMTFDPTDNLLPGTTYKIMIGKAARSRAGLNMTTGYTWSFTTRPAPSAALTVASAPTASGAQITLNLAFAAGVTVSIRNLAGRGIALLQPGQLQAGVRTLLWNCKSCAGTKVPAGTYLLEATARSADGSSTKAVTSLALR